MSKTLLFQNIKISGFSTTVPKLKMENRDSELFLDEQDYHKFLETTGIKHRFVVGDSGLCSSDLCVDAAQRLLHSVGWSAESIDVLIFVSQTPDYPLPATSCVIQERLGLSNGIYAMDISLGCSGWVYGFSTVCALLESGVFKRALLLAGDTTSRTKSPQDRSTFPLFGDAGTATAIEYSEGYGITAFDFGTDGSGFDAIMIKDGGYRNPTKESSLITELKDDGKIRNDLQSILNGAEVFTFGITQAPKSIKQLLGNLGMEISEVNTALFHQANFMMNERIRNKLGLTEQQVPYSLHEFGNTSSASIVLTLCHNKTQLPQDAKVLACGFGVGLSWGTVVFPLKEPEILEIQYI